MRLSLALLALSLAAPAPAADPTPEQATQIVNKAGTFMLQKQPAQALALLETALASYDRPLADAGAKGQVYCATSAEEGLVYSAMGAGISSTVLPATLCNALFLKAYVLTELKREPEAVAVLERLTALAPMHAHYFVELGYAYRVTGEPDKAMQAYRHALQSATDGKFHGDEAKRERAAALRGIGYLLIDRNDLDGAADSYRKSLADDPDSAIARSELVYIEQMRKRSR